MKLIFIRHGEPDYENDALTPVGAREAELLVPRVKKMDAKEYFVSPLGRAKATARPSLEALGVEAKELDWLREFDIKVQRPDRPAGSPGMCWDWLPSDWMAHDAFYDKEHWADHPVMSDNGIGERYKYVTEKFDEFLKERGYVRNGRLYDAVSPNNDSYVFFCHFGCLTLFMSYLLNISPMILWHGLCALPSSVTTIVTEERKKGTAHWRCLEYGDTSHLYAAGEKPSFAARFCECFDNADERHL